jgi:HAD superfamily hydrolase (TIGR01450 family)
VLLIVDLDGVVYRGPEPIPGMPELLRRREVLGDVIVYATNNSSRHRSDFAGILKAIGAPVSAERVVTSARATALFLQTHVPAVHTTLVLGGPGLRRELRDAGIGVAAPTRLGLARRPEAVAVGIDRQLSYARLAYGADAIRAGALFVATNRDPVYPGPDGRLLPGAGAVVAALEVSTGRLPIVIGKPEPGLFVAAAAIAGVPPAEAVVLGDGLGTDVAAARRIGARSVLMLTGVTTAVELQAAPPDQRPSAVAADAVELAEVLDRFSREG